MDIKPIGVMSAFACRGRTGILWSRFSPRPSITLCQGSHCDESYAPFWFSLETPGRAEAEDQVAEPYEPAPQGRGSRLTITFSTEEPSERGYHSDSLP